MRLADWLQQATDRLQAASVESAAHEARLLLAQVLDTSLAHLLTWPDQLLTDVQLATANAQLQQRLQGLPLAWVLGSWSFWGLDLKVSPATLIPRADTEVLVEQALALPLPEGARVIDLGTGTGALALALKSERPHWQLDAVDLQAETVQLARENARDLQLNVRIWCSDWWQQVPFHDYDLVISNPPYIHPQDPHLQQGDLRHEPQTALVGGVDGLAAYRAILAQASQRLKPGGWLLVEQGYDQAEAVAALFRQVGLTGIQQLRDPGGHLRTTAGQYHAG